MTLLQFMVVLVATLPAVSSDWAETIFGTKIQVQETSGKITFSRVNELTVAFKKVVEIGENGDMPKGSIVHSFNNFENTVFKISDISSLQEVYANDSPQNISAVRKNMTAKLEGPASLFSVQFLIFQNNSIIYQGEKYQVFNGTVQVSVTLERWPFCGISEMDCNVAGKYLEFSFEVKGLLNDPKPYQYNRGVSLDSRSLSPFTYDYGGGDVTYSRKYFLNNTWFDIPGDYPQLVKEGNQNLVVVRLPLFKVPITYSFMVNTSFANFTAVRSCSVNNKSGEILYWFMLAISLFIFIFY